MKMKRFSIILAVVLCLMMLLTGCDVNVSSLTGGLINPENIINNIEGIGELIAGLGDLSSIIDETIGSESEYYNDWQTSVEKNEGTVSAETDIQRPDSPGKETVEDIFGEEISGLAPELSENYYGGREVRVVSSDEFNGWFYNTSYTSSTVYSAVYQRNEVISNQLGISILCSYTNSSDYRETALQQQVENYILAGQPYDLVVGQAYAIQTLATKGYMLNWYDTQVDLHREWWYEDAKDQFETVSGRLYVLSGDASHNTMENSLVTYFNSNLLKERGINADKLYSYVENGYWTYEKLFSVAKSAYVDSNCDGRIDDYDTFGCVFDDMTIYAAIAGTGVHLVERNGVNWEFCNNNSGEIGDALEAIQLFTEKSNAFQFDSSLGTQSISIFSMNSSCFYTDTLSAAEAFKLNEMEYGILPAPMAREGISSYNSLVFSSSYMLGWCGGGNDIELISDLVDLMGYYGNQSTRFEYFYSIALSEQDYRMLEKIRDTLFFDHAYAMGYSGMYKKLAVAVKNGEGIYSKLAENKDSIVVAVRDWDYVAGSVKYKN